MIDRKEGSQPFISYAGTEPDDAVGRGIRAGFRRSLGM
jgi:hypothetical protein